MFSLRLPLLASLLLVSADARPLQVLIVAGQSNILNWHVSARDLPADPIDASVRFWYFTGGTQNKRPSPPQNSSSGGAWVTLRAQRQEPFIRFEPEYFGPEMTLARSLARGDQGSVAVIKVGFGGTNLAEEWHPEAKDGPKLYSLLRREVDLALKELAAEKIDYQLAGFFWMQGEADAKRADHASAYGRNFALLVATLRKDLSAPDLPVVLARVGPRPPKNCEYQDDVRAAQVQAAAQLPGLRWVDTDDLPRDTDSIHLMAGSVLKLGERWAAEWLALRRSTPETSRPAAR